MAVRPRWAQDHSRLRMQVPARRALLAQKKGPAATILAAGPNKVKKLVRIQTLGSVQNFWVSAALAVKPSGDAVNGS